MGSSATPRLRATLRLLALLPFLPSPAFALSCPPATVSELIRTAPSIFEARVLDAPVTDQQHQSAAIAVEVTRVLKGQVPARTHLHSSTLASLGRAFATPPAPGQVVLAFGHPRESGGGFGVGGCGAPLYTPDRAAPRELVAIADGLRPIEAEIAASPGALAPRLAEARFRLPWDPTGALASFRRLAADHPDLAAAHLGAGRALLLLRRHDEAITTLERAASLPASGSEAARLIDQARLLAGDRAVLAWLRDFSGIEADRVDITGLPLRSADFSEARLGHLRAARADLRGANLTGLRVGREHWPDPTAQDANLQGADLRGIRGERLVMHRSMLDGARLEDARLEGASLSGSSMERARLAGADLRGAGLDRVSLVGADLRHARLARANLSFSDLRGADLRGADLRGADLFSAFHDCRTRFPAGFDPDAQGLPRRTEGCPTR